MDRVKRRPINFQAGVDGRQLRANRRSIERKSLRRSVFDRQRTDLESLDMVAEEPLVETAVPIVEPTVELPRLSRREMLKRWKEEKELKRKLDAEKRSVKPAFKVYHLEHKLPSYLVPVVSTTKVAAAKNKRPVIMKPEAVVFEKRVTRAAAAAARAKTVVPALAPTSELVPELVKGKHSKRNVVVPPVPSKRVTSGIKKNLDIVEPTVEECSFAPKNFQFVAPAGLDNNDFTNTKIMSSNSIDSFFSSPHPQFSSATIPEQSVVDEISEQVSDKPEADQSFQACIAFESNLPLGVPHFRNLLDANTARLQRLCDEWALILDRENILSDNVVGRIRSVVGKANLLIKERFDQFSKLVDDCEFNRGDKLINSTDLQGFWEMILPQVKECFEKFEKLTRIRSNSFIDEETPIKVLPKQRRCRNSKFASKLEFNVSKVENGDRNIAARNRLAEFKKAAAKLKKTSANHPLDESSSSEVVLSSSIKPTESTDVEFSSLGNISISAVISPPMNCSVEVIDLNKSSNRRSSLCRTVRQKNFVDNIMSIATAQVAASEVIEESIPLKKSRRNSRRLSSVSRPFNDNNQSNQNVDAMLGLSPFGTLKINEDVGNWHSGSPKLSRRSDLIRFSDVFSNGLPKSVDKENYQQNPLAPYLMATTKEQRSFTISDSPFDE